MGAEVVGENDAHGNEPHGEQVSLVTVKPADPGEKHVKHRGAREEAEEQLAHFPKPEPPEPYGVQELRENQQPGEGRDEKRELLPTQGEESAKAQEVRRMPFQKHRVGQPAPAV